jgi:hypothetical protein
MRKRALTSAVLLFGLALAGCDSFDPLDKFQEWDIMGSGKTPLQGPRREVFPSGVPGVPQGVPPDLVKGYQPPAEEPPPVVEAKPAKGKQKQAQKKTTTAARRQAPPQQPEPELEEEPAPPPARTQPARAGQMQPMPGSQPTWPSGAQPAPQR